MKKAVFLFLPLLLLAPMGFSGAQRPDAPEYAQRGQYPVGTREFVIEDGTRPLKVTAWYPALNPDGLEESITYREGLAMVEGRALLDAEPDAGSAPYPLIIYSHGSGGLRYNSVFYTEHLASYGFVVLALDHPGNTVLDRLTSPDTFESNVTDNYALRPLDVLRVIALADELAAEGGAFAGLIDMARIGMSGHSFGGYTALAIGGAQLNMDSLVTNCSEQNEDEQAEIDIQRCRFADVARIAELRGYEAAPTGVWPATTDERIQAVVALAPCCMGQFTDGGLDNYDTPTLFIMGSLDPVTVSPEYITEFAANLSAPQTGVVSLENAGHFVFVDECSDQAIAFGLYDSCSDDVWDMARAHDLINHYATAYFLSLLYGDEAATAALDPETAVFPGVDYTLGN